MKLGKSEVYQYLNQSIRFYWVGRLSAQYEHVQSYKLVRDNISKLKHATDLKLYKIYDALSSTITNRYEDNI
jgi:hypothetical protein